MFASGARLKQLREKINREYKEQLLKKGINDPQELRRLLKNQEETDFHTMGYSNRRYIKEMLRGSKEITEEVLLFYSEKACVTREWILYGSLLEHICYVMNPLPQTVSKEECLRIEIEAKIQGVSYEQVEKFFQIAQELKILKEITPFTNIVDLYDEGDKGKGQLLLIHHIYFSPNTSTFPKALLNQLIKVINTRQAFLLTSDSLFLRFIDECVRLLPKETQNFLSLVGGTRELITQIDGEFSLTECLTEAEGIQIIPKLNKMCRLAQQERLANMEYLVHEFGADVTSEAYLPYYQKLLKVLTTFDALTNEELNLVQAKAHSKTLISNTEIDQAFDFKRNIKEEQTRKKSEKTLEQLLELLESKA